MPTVLRFKPDINALAVYETADVLNPADAPVNDPLNNLSAIKFHSGLRYPRFIPAKFFNFSVTFSGVSGLDNRQINQSNSVYAHGMGDVPIVFAKYVNGTSSVRGNDPPEMMRPGSAWAGTIPLMHFGGNCTVWGAVGADATNVVVNVYGTIPDAVGSFGTFTINGRGYVLDTTITTDAFDADGALPQLELTGTRIRAGRGKFDTNFSYMRQGSTSEAVTLVKGESIVIKGTPNAAPLGDANQNWGYRYSVNGNVADSGLGGTSTFAAAFETAGL